jgi:hypothetical protein
MNRLTSLAFASSLRGAHHRIQVEAISEFAVLASLIATGHYCQGATRRQIPLARRELPARANWVSAL